MRITCGQSTCSSRRIRKKLCPPSNNRRNRERGRRGKYPPPSPAAGKPPAQRAHRRCGIIVPKEGIASEHSEQQLNGTLGKPVPLLFCASSVDDRQAQEPWGNIRPGHGHGQGADLSGQTGTVRRGLPLGGRGQRLKRRAALHRVSLPAVQNLWEPLLCRGLHPWKAGISPGNGLGGGAGRLPPLGALWDLLREHEIESERPLPGKTRQRFFLRPAAVLTKPPCWPPCGPVCGVFSQGREVPGPAPKRPTEAQNQASGKRPGSGQQRGCERGAG